MADDDFSFYIKADPSQALEAEKAVLDGLINMENEVARAGHLFQEMGEDGVVAIGKVKKVTNEATDGMEKFGKQIATVFAVHELVGMADDFETISNRMRVLTASTEEFSIAMTDTLAAADAARTSWDEVVGTYQKLSNATEQYNLSQKQVIDLTQEMAEAAKIGGANNQQTAQAMSELTHAFASGTVQGREFRVLMRDTPALMHELQMASGLTGSAFADMGKHGQITAQDLIDWFGKADKDIKDKFAKTVPTISDQWAVFKNNLTAGLGALAEQTHIFDAIGAVFKAIGSTLDIVLTLIKGVTSAIGEMGVAVVALTASMAINPVFAIGAAVVFGINAIHGALDSLVDSLNAEHNARIAAYTTMTSQIEVYKKMEDAIAANAQAAHDDYIAHSELLEGLNEVAAALAGGQAIRDAASQAYQDQTAKVQALRAAVQGLQRDIAGAGGGAKGMSILNEGDVKIIRDYQDAQEKLIDMGSRYGDQLEKIHTKETERQRGISDLNEMVKAGIITQKEYADSIKQYLGPLSDLQKLINDINEPQITFHKTQLLLNQAFMSGAISFDQYAAAMSRAVKAENEGLESRRQDPASITGGQLNTSAIDTSGFSSMISNASKAAEGNSLAQQFGNNADIEKYIADMALLQHGLADGAISAQTFSQMKGKLDEQMGASVDPMQKLNEKQDKLNELYSIGALTAKDYATQSAKITMEQQKIADSGKTLTDGLSRGWHTVQDQMRDVATDSSKLITDAYADIQSALDQLITNGSVDWSKMVQGMVLDLAHLAEKQITAKIFDVGSQTASAAAAGTATGTSAVATMTTAAPTIGALIGASASEAMAAGQAAQTGASDIGAALGAGADIALTAAGGNQWTVGGSGGAQDSQVVAFRASPGERVTVDHGPHTGSLLNNDGPRSSGNAPVTIHVLNDQKAIVAAMSHPMAQQVMLSTFQRAQRYVKPKQ